MKRLFLGFVIISMLGACTLKKTSGDIYLLISPKEGNIEQHTLIRISSVCFLKDIECSTPETISAFPKEYFPPYLFAPMFWSPDGKYLLSVINISNYPQSLFDTRELLSYDSQAGKTTKIISGNEYIDDIAWNPNSKWAVVSLTDPVNKAVQMILINPHGEKRMLPIEPSNDIGNISPNYPIQSQWINEHELSFIREKPEGKLGIPTIHLVKFNIETKVETEIQIPSMEDYFILSPDGTFAFFPFPINNVVNIYNFKTQETTALKGFQSKQPLHWSPDGKWILACSDENETYIVSPDIGETQKIIDGCTNYYNWMSDSDHIILLYFSYLGNSFEVVDSHWYIASISANTVREITIPSLDLKENHIDGIYVQPIKP